MIFTPPEIEITGDKPFQNDRLARQPFAETLTHLVAASSDNLVLLVNARWGEGKTVFAKMWQASLGKERGAIYFDAFEADHSDDPFLCICSAILDFAEKFAPEQDLEDTKEKRKRLLATGKQLLSVAAKVGISALTAGILKADHIDEVTRAATEAASEAVKDRIGAAFDDQLENHSARLAAVRDFREKLAALGAAVKAITQGFPLVIIVDELDRCRPDFALRLLERIKHLFGVPNVVFVLFANLEQLQRHVEHVYGGGDDINQYLSKFVHLITDLPANRSGRGADDYDAVSSMLFKHHGIEAFSGEVVQMKGIIVHWTRKFRMSLRELERLIAALAVFCGGQNPDNPIGYAFEKALLMVLLTKKPRLFQSIRRQIATLPEVLKELELLDGAVSPHTPDAYAYDFFTAFLMRKEDIETATPRIKNRLSNVYDLTDSHRREIIAKLCDDVVVFRPFYDPK